MNWQNVTESERMRVLVNSLKRSSKLTGYWRSPLRFNSCWDLSEWH